MSGHVFVVHGDLTHLACDEWLLPTDRDLTLTDAWLPTLAQDAVGRGPDGVPTLRLDAPEEFCAGRRRVLRVPDEALATPIDGSPVTRGCPWLLDVGSGGDLDVDWLVDGVRAWLEETGTGEQRSGRDRPLLALPLIGTGAGGAAERRDDVLERLLPALHEHAERCDVDVALVLNDARDHAAAQVVRHRLRDTDDGPGGWDLDPGLVKAVERLAERANDGRLALFLGAGVGRAAGLPLWQELIDELCDEAQVDSEERAAVGRLDVPDQAEFLARRLGDEDMQRWLQRRFAPRPHALAHALLAALPVRESVTTNWDPLFEQAVADTDRRLSVLPFDLAEQADSWLLKLHGDASRGGEMVVRRSDYLRFGAEQSALAGVVQALLFTRHLLFVGFSLLDDNVIRITDDVTRLVDRYAPAGGDTAGEPRLGTTLALHRDPAKQELWPHLDHLVVGGARPGEDEASDSGELARRLEIVLDLLSARVRHDSHYLLDERYDGLLGEADRALAERLHELTKSADELRESMAWPAVEQFLRGLGGGDVPTRA